LPKKKTKAFIDGDTEEMAGPPRVMEEEEDENGDDLRADLEGNSPDRDIDSSSSVCRTDRCYCRLTLNYGRFNSK